VLKRHHLLLFTKNLIPTVRANSRNKKEFTIICRHFWEDVLDVFSSLQPNNIIFHRDYNTLFAFTTFALLCNFYFYCHNLKF